MFLGQSLYCTVHPVVNKTKNELAKCSIIRPKNTLLFRICLTKTKIIHPSSKLLAEFKKKVYKVKIVGHYRDSFFSCSITNYWFNCWIRYKVFKYSSVLDWENNCDICTCVTCVFIHNMYSYNSKTIVRQAQEMSFLNQKFWLYNTLVNLI